MSIESDYYDWDLHNKGPEDCSGCLNEPEKCTCDEPVSDL